MLKISYIKLLKHLYLKAPNESHSCILLFNVLYNIVPLYQIPPWAIEHYELGLQTIIKTN